MSLKYKSLVKARHVTETSQYDVLLAPVVTEKATLGQQFNQITFRVAPKATKPQIRQAVESIFKVKVEAVNTLNQQGKVKRFRGRLGKRDNTKKAIVTLAQGQSIDISTGI